MVLSVVVIVVVVEVVASDVGMWFLDVVVVFGCSANVPSDNGLQSVASY